MHSPLLPWTSCKIFSQRRHAAVHEQQGAGDVGGIVGGQEQDCGGDLLGPARALQHGASCSLGVVLLDGLAGRREAALAALVVSYCRLPPPATTERTEATLTMAPPLSRPWSRRISGTAALAQK